MIKNILPFYEREHANISALLGEFAEQYPQLATTLGIVDGVCEDAHVQRIVEGMVMLGARILQQLEDSYPPGFQRCTQGCLRLSFAKRCRGLGQSAQR